MTQKPVSLELTDRERELLAYVANGRSNKSTAQLMNIATDTVRSHLGRIFYKLGARDRAHAVALAMRAGLINPQLTGVRKGPR